MINHLKNLQFKINKKLTESIEICYEIGDYYNTYKYYTLLLDHEPKFNNIESFFPLYNIVYYNNNKFYKWNYKPKFKKNTCRKNNTLILTLIKDFIK